MDLEDPQIQLLLLGSCLCSCLSSCKMIHLLRTVPPDKAIDQLCDFDMNQHHTLEAIVQCSIPDSSWQQATLPVHLGGLGLREAKRCLAAAYLGSCNSIQNLASCLLPSASASSPDQSASVSPKFVTFPGESVAGEYLQHLLPNSHTTIWIGLQLNMLYKLF